MHYLVDLVGYQFEEGQATWIHAMPPHVDKKHPIFGDIKITPDRIQRYAASVKNKVRGIDLDIDYDHKKRRDDAAGWVKDADARPDGLWLLVELTKEAVQKVKNKEYRYFSPEYANEWEGHKDVIFGGGLTNRPFLKNLVPINLSEVLTEEDGMDEKLKVAIIKRLGLSQDASDDDVMQALNAEPQPFDLSNAKAEKQDDGSFKVTADGATGEVVVKPETVKASEGENEELKKLAEDNPAIAKLLADQEEQAKQLKALETANRLSEVNVQLSELTQIPPDPINDLREVAVVLPKQLSDKVIGAVKKIQQHGLVPLGQESGGKTDTSTDRTGADKVTKYLSAIDEYMEKHEGVTYGDAAIRVLEEQPKLFEGYQEALKNNIALAEEVE